MYFIHFGNNLQNIYLLIKMTKIKLCLSDNNANMNLILNTKEQNISTYVRNRGSLV